MDIGIGIAPASGRGEIHLDVAILPRLRSAARGTSNPVRGAQLPSLRRGNRPSLRF
jgi:hypothetical protein